MSDGHSTTFIPLQMTFFVSLPNFPEWAIPMTKLICRCYVDDGWDTSQVSWNTNFRYWWNKVDDKNWEIRAELYVQATMIIADVGTVIPGYVDIDLVIMNERVWDELNPNKS